MSRGLMSMPQLSPTNCKAFSSRLQIPAEMKTCFPGLGLEFLGNNGSFQVISEISQVKGTGQSFDPIHKEPVSILKSEDRVYHGSTGQTGWWQKKATQTLCSGDTHEVFIHLSLTSCHNFSLFFFFSGIGYTTHRAQETGLQAVSQCCFSQNSL